MIIWQWAEFYFKSNQNRPKMLLLPQKLTLNLYYDMRFIIVFFMFATLLNGPLQAQHRMIISEWLVTSPLEVSYPFGHHIENTLGKPFANSDLLLFTHLDLSASFPESGQVSFWPGRQPFMWDVASTNSNGYMMLGNSITPQKPQLAYLATYINTGH